MRTIMKQLALSLLLLTAGISINTSTQLSAAYTAPQCSNCANFNILGTSHCPSCGEAMSTEATNEVNSLAEQEAALALFRAQREVERSHEKLLNQQLEAEAKKAAEAAAGRRASTIAQLRVVSESLASQIAHLEAQLASLKSDKDEIDARIAAEEAEVNEELAARIAEEEIAKETDSDSGSGGGSGVGGS